ncbi:MAG: retroviral-like aspartic protease family protein [Defluviitaleaceae bacterium]|nr:retroviral-like aspartic protease family protein [Defluviitaleaceae bacterium]
METYTLEMHKQGNHLHVYAGLWDLEMKKFRKGLLLFDTGASTTTISCDVLHDLGYDVTSGKQHRITTASGIAYVREVIVNDFKIGGCVLNDVMVYAHTFPEESFTTGVIGLNVISMFDVNMLFSKLQIELKKLP